MYLYLVRMTDKAEDFHKIGVSKDPLARFSFGSQRVLDSDLDLGEKIKRVLNQQVYIPDEFPYNVEYIHKVLFQFDGEALRAEASILARHHQFTYSPLNHFSGYSECIKVSNDTLDSIISLMDRIEYRAKTANVDQNIYELRQTILNSTLMLGNRPKISDPIELHEKTMKALGLEPISLD